MRGNIVFNFISRLFTAFSTFLFVPFYIAILGPDGYSIIALSLVVVSLVLILEIGLSAAISREMARQDITDGQRRRAFIAIERLFAILFFMAALMGFLFSNAIAYKVVGDTAVDKRVVSSCLSLIVIEAGLQLLMRFYISVLTGLERQIQASMFTMLWVVLRNGAVIGAIWLWPDLHIFFVWQLAATLTVVLALKVRSLGLVRAWPSTQGPFLDLETFQRLRSFAGGMLLISLVAVVNTQLDRVLIGSMTSLRELGAYMLAASLGTAILIASTPIMTAVQPRLTSYFTNGQTEEARVLFQKATRLVALIIFPPVMMITSNPEAVLMAWVGEPEMVHIASPIVPFLVIANASIALATIAYATALANGYTRLNNITGITSLFVSIPGYFLALRYAGVVGVAAVFLSIQLASTFTFSWLAMKRFFGGGLWHHHLVNYAVPAIGALLGAWLFRSAFAPMPENRAMLLLSLAAGLVVSGAVGTGLAWGVWKLADPQRPTPKLPAG